MAFSVGGLTSGFDTASLVESLIYAEGAQQRALKTKLTTTQKAAEGYRSVNTKFDALKTAADALLKPATWAPAKVTSSATSVSAAVTGEATTSSLTFNVTGIAAAHSVISDQKWTATSEASGFGSTLSTSRGDITITGTSLADAVTSINKSGLGFTAAAIQTAPGEYRLQVTSQESGSAKQFTVGAADTFDVVTAGTNAQLRVGTGAGAYDVSSSSNTFADLMPGVTLTVTKPETGVTVSSVADPEAVAGSVKAFVDAANAVLAEIKKQTATGKSTSGAASGTKGALAGDFPLSRIASQVRDMVSALVPADGSPGTAGVELTRDGTVNFNKEKFLKSLADDPAKTHRLMAGVPGNNGPDQQKGTIDDVKALPGVAMRMRDLIVDSLTDKYTGSLTLLAQGRDKTADDIKGKIDEWDTRLAARRKSMQRQFTAMETALGTMKNQSSWLSGQIATLATY